MSNSTNEHLERKSLTLENASVDDDGLLVGYASVFGNIDRSNEVVVKGAFSNLDAFIRDGFVAQSHDWDELPIATVESAVQDDYGLKVMARFHSHEHAQSVRTMVMERLERGKSVGLSIGYVVTDDSTDNGIRYLHSIELYEFSVVTVPCNPAATVTAAKGTRLTDQTDNALTVVADLVERVNGLASIRAAQNRKPLGQKAATALGDFLGGLQTLMDELHTILDDADAISTGDDNADDNTPSVDTDGVDGTPDNEATDTGTDGADVFASDDDAMRVYAEYLATTTE